MSNKIKTSDIEAVISGMEVCAAVEYLEKVTSQGTSFERLKAKYIKKRDAYLKEIARFNEMCIYEKDLHSKGYKFIAGIDEVGRGPLAGPVVAAAAILPEDVFIEGLNDSKQVSPKIREQLYYEIKDKALGYGIGIIDEKCIDSINILNATKEAMKLAVSQMTIKPDMLLIDALNLDDVDIPQTGIIKGDCLSISIAAASILAKVTRDRIIESYDEVYPQYGFAKNKGYGTEDHINAIKKYGICPIHRLSFVKNIIAFDRAKASKTRRSGAAEAARAQ